MVHGKVLIRCLLTLALFNGHQSIVVCEASLQTKIHNAWILSNTFTQTAQNNYYLVTWFPYEGNNCTLSVKFTTEIAKRQIYI